jgi:hypothetical protein
VPGLRRGKQELAAGTLTPSILVRIQVPHPDSSVSGVYFPHGQKSSTFLRVRLRASVSGRQFLGFPSFGRGFRAPVSARFFPISVSGEGRLVRLLPETGSGLTAARGQQPRSALLSESYSRRGSNAKKISTSLLIQNSPTR